MQQVPGGKVGRRSLASTRADQSHQVRRSPTHRPHRSNIPASASSAVRARRTHALTALGERVATRTTTPSPSHHATSIAKRIPNVCTWRAFDNTSTPSMPSRPSKPRRRSRCELAISARASTSSLRRSSDRSTTVPCPDSTTSTPPADRTTNALVGAVDSIDASSSVPVVRPRRSTRGRRSMVRPMEWASK